MFSTSALDLIKGCNQFVTKAIIILFLLIDLKSFKMRCTEIEGSEKFHIHDDIYTGMQNEPNGGCIKKFMVLNSKNNKFQSSRTAG